MARKRIYSVSRVPPQEVTPNDGDDHEALLETITVARFDWKSLSKWRVAKCLLVLRQQVDDRAPGRSKVKDGTIGDQAHQGRESDHNPHVRDDGIGVVTALDITHDPDRACDVGTISEALRSGRDQRIKYVIWDGRLFSSYEYEGIDAWTWRAYQGQDPHDGHVHISVVANRGLYDSQNLWALPVLP